MVSIFCQFALFCVGTVLVQATFQDYSIVLPVGALMLIAVVVMACVACKSSQSRVIKVVSILFLSLSALQLPDTIFRRLFYAFTHPQTKAEQQTAQAQEKAFKLKQQILEEELRQQKLKEKYALPH